jgi:cyanate permease
LRKPRRTRAYWHLPLIHGLGCAGHGIVLLYVVPLAVEQGLTLVSASVILSLISVWSIGSRLLTPIVAERSGGKPVMAATLLIQGLTLLVLFGAHDVWTFYLFGSLFGIGFGGEMLIPHWEESLPPEARTVPTGPVPVANR